MTPEQKKEIDRQLNSAAGTTLQNIITTTVKELFDKVHEHCPGPGDGMSVHASGTTYCDRCLTGLIDELRNENFRHELARNGLTNVLADTTKERDQLRAENERLRRRLQRLADLSLGCNCSGKSDCCAAMDGVIEGNRRILTNNGGSR